jgi:GT2 family glycosyltransferase
MNVEVKGVTAPTGLLFISIIIAAHNDANVIAHQLDALAAQAYHGPWEIVIVDNCSTDHLAAVVCDYQSRLPNLSFVSASAKPNLSYARNVGARMAGGNALLFCDTDDIAAPGWLAAMAKALEDHDVVAGAVEVQSLNQSAVRRPYFSYEGPFSPALDFLPYMVGCNMAFTRTAFDAIGGFNEAYQRSQDIEISWRLQLHAYKLHYAPDAIIHYRYRKRLSNLWSQVSAYSMSYPLLYKNFASHGMPRSSLMKALKRYLWLVWNIRKTFDTNIDARAQWIYWAAVSWGRLKGSLYYRTLYL